MYFMKKITLLFLIAALSFSFHSSFSQSAFLYQAAFNGTEYEYGYSSKPRIEITGAPDDIDWNRWSMLHDGGNYRLFFMPIGRSEIGRAHV